jgi:hypothetical protein
MCWWPIDKPVPYARNNRKIPERTIDKVAASIKEFGWRQAIVVHKDGVIICGHTRLLAARKLGLREVPVHVADNLTPAQVKAYRLMDNRSHKETGWDLELLGPELEELQGLDFDLELTGFSERELEDLLADPDQIDQANQIPDVLEHPVTVRGDLWLLGKPPNQHRILCGDSNRAAAGQPVCGRLCREPGSGQPRRASGDSASAAHRLPIPAAPPRLDIAGIREDRRSTLRGLRCSYSGTVFAAGVSVAPIISGPLM